MPCCTWPGGTVPDLFTLDYEGPGLAGVDEVGRGPLAGDVVAAAADGAAVGAYGHTRFGAAFGGIRAATDVERAGVEAIIADRKRQTRQHEPSATARRANGARGTKEPTFTGRVVVVLALAHACRAACGAQFDDGRMSDAKPNLTADG